MRNNICTPVQVAPMPQSHPRAEKMSLRLLAKISVVLLFFLFRGIPIENSSSYLVQLLSSYSIATVLFVAGLIVFSTSRIYAFIKPNSRSFFLPFYVPLLISLMVCITIALMWSTYTTTGVEQKMWYTFVEFASSLVVIHLVYLSFISVREITGALQGIWIASLLMGVYFLYVWLGTSIPLIRLGTPGSTGATYNTAAYSLAAGIWVGPLSAIIARHQFPNFRALIIQIGLIIFLLIAILLTGSKGGMLTTMAFVVLWVVLVRFRRLNKMDMIFFWSAIIIISSLLLILTKIEPLDPVHHVAQLFRINSLQSSGRVDMWFDAIAQIFSSPTSILFGIGLGEYQYFDGLYEYTYPHNIFLDLAVNIGFPAAIFLGIIIWKTFIIPLHCLKARRIDPETQLLALKLVGLGFTAMISGLTCFRFSSNFLLWIFIGLTARLHTINRSQRALVRGEHY